MMQKDEDLLLEAWILYHAQLFGLANLSVFDNGSQRAAVHRILDRYEALGLFVERGFATAADFAAKGEVVGARMRALRDTGRYDFLFPLDCDEFVALRTQTGFVCAPGQIHGYLAGLRGRRETLKIQSEFLNAPRAPGYYRLIYCNKTFYAAASFSHTDHGFHTAGARDSTAFFVSDVAHVHYHNKSFGRLRADARRKLQGLGVAVDDPAALAALDHCRHLVPYFSMTQSAYLQRAETLPHCYQPEFIRRLALVGATNRSLLKPCHDGQHVPSTLVPAEFSQTAYWAANADIAAARMDALLHYSMFGHSEGRRIAPD